ncbi:MAG: hypothetical protein Q8O55_08725 [Dehalococcoidales bacterium]|nr:hypothetical protein [Dehalococcoidales bacterium]
METDERGLLTESALREIYGEKDDRIFNPYFLKMLVAIMHQHQADVDAARGAKNPYKPAYHQHAKIDWLAYEQARQDILLAMGADINEGGTNVPA